MPGKQYSSGGATFTPRLTPRPKNELYPTAAEILWNITVPYIRSSFLCVLFAHFAYPILYLPILNYCMKKPMLWGSKEEEAPPAPWSSGVFRQSRRGTHCRVQGDAGQEGTHPVGTGNGDGKDCAHPDMQE